MRSVLSDIFREAIVEGHIEMNPVRATRIVKPVVKRERSDLEQYLLIRKAASHMPVWIGLAMDLALVTCQRREDIATMKFSHIINDRLRITQGKTGMMISIPLSLKLEAVNLEFRKIIEQCRAASSTDYLISADARKNSSAGALHLDTLTKNFSKARK